jgi:hypothetical protein
MTFSATLNLLYGQVCPPVVCQTTGPAFRYFEDEEWHQVDDLPEHIAEALPGPEWNRCENHRHRRMGDRE